MRNTVCLYCFWVVWLVVAVVAASSDPLPEYDEAIKKARAAEARFNYADALKWYQTAWDIDTSDVGVLLAISEQYTGLEQLDKARDTFLQVIERDPGRAEAHTLLAIYYEKFADKVELAAQHYEQAIEADEKYPRPRILYMRLLIQMEQLKEAETHARLLMRLFPENHEGAAALGRIALRRGDIDKAVVHLRQAVSSAPSESEPYRWLGQALARSGQREQAQEALKRYQQIKEEKELISDWVTRVRRDPSNANHWFQLGKAYLKQNQTDPAVHAFQMGLELAPDTAGVHAVVGALYLKKKQVEAAQKHFETAIALEPNNADYFNNLGVCYLLRGDYRQAVYALQTAVDLGKEEPGILRNLHIAKQKLQVEP